MKSSPTGEYSFVITSEADYLKITKGLKTTQIFLENLPLKTGDCLIFKKFFPNGEGLVDFGRTIITSVRVCGFNEISPIEVITCGFDSDENCRNFFQSLKPGLQPYDTVTIAKWMMFDSIPPSSCRGI